MADKTISKGGLKVRILELDPTISGLQKQLEKERGKYCTAHYKGGNSQYPAPVKSGNLTGVTESEIYLQEITDLVPQPIPTTALEYFTVFEIL
ncbi:MAG: hypothetical protein PVJ67_06445 [Candidatus Pacearchaeota archaeon]|jgi:hypothetical protein